MLYAEYNYCSLDNITYTVDMMRLRCDITNETFEKLVARLRTIYSDQIDNFYISSGISDFKYNYNIKIKEGSSFWFGFIHNSELINKKGSLQNDKTEFNFTVEFNPNKLEIKGILLYIIRMCYAHNCNVKSVDIAMDIPFNILDIRWL